MRATNDAQSAIAEGMVDYLDELVDQTEEHKVREREIQEAVEAAEMYEEMGSDNCDRCGRAVMFGSLVTIIDDETWTASCVCELCLRVDRKKRLAELASERAA